MIIASIDTYNILDIVATAVEENDTEAAVKDSRLGRSRNYDDINSKTLERIKLLVCQNAPWKVLNDFRLGRSIHKYISKTEY